MEKSLDDVIKENKQLDKKDKRGGNNGGRLQSVLKGKNSRMFRRTGNPIQKDRLNRNQGGQIRNRRNGHIRERSRQQPRQRLQQRSIRQQPRQIRQESRQIQFNRQVFEGKGRALKLFNLSPDINEAELYNLVVQYGAVEQCTIQRDVKGKSLESATIVFRDSESADEAKKDLHRNELEGRCLTVEIYKLSDLGQIDKNQNQPPENPRNRDTDQRQVRQRNNSQSMQRDRPRQIQRRGFFRDDRRQSGRDQRITRNRNQMGGQRQRLGQRRNGLGSVGNRFGGGNRQRNFRGGNRGNGRRNRY